MKKIFLVVLTLMSVVSCDKTTVNNVVDNPDYTKRKNNNNNNNTTLSLKEYLLPLYDANSNGTLERSEIASLTTLDAAGKGLTSLEGLEDLVNLKQANFSGNNIMSATVKNVMLEELDLSNNKLISLDISQAPRLVDKLNVKGNQNLNCVKITQLQLTKFSRATSLQKDSHTNLSPSCS
ncbi:MULTISPECIES: hypothetical protein [unclassified Capnocytophaga]|uniref:hypothetical protein n=1 Tax=unclassified Capnocytophaga TaxID=2640652 RepID=UPI000202CBB8|nr:MULTISPECIES: hypothetical protein [unclassified Capnocytophaga]EGD35051.1 hypothetical protein HMPREF9071_0342 [Capnocytophaga sp. oral taxon 338 str. F0234]MEB3003917.1 hypothetical protein [Capnocytophaga sp. G2]